MVRWNLVREKAAVEKLKGTLYDKQEEILIKGLNVTV